MGKSDYKEIFDLFDLAEKKIKEIELLDIIGLPIPSVNQLRYAGRHTLESLVSNEEDVTNTNIFEAKDHCKRAIYDAMEIGIVYHLYRLKIFKEDYKEFPVSTVVPDYIKKLKRITEIQQFISDANRMKEAYFEKIQLIYEEIRVISDYFDTSRQVINEAIMRENKTILRAKRRELYTLIVIGIAILSTLISVILKTFF